MANHAFACATESHGAAGRRWLEPFLLASLLPALLVAADTTMLNQCRLARWQGWPIFASYALYVIQTALLSTLLGRRLRHIFLKWVVFVWALLLVDFLAFTVALSGTSWGSCLGYSFLSGQVGMLIVWGILGTAPGALRLPAAIVGLVVVTYFSAELHDEFWFPILTWQGVATAVFIGLVWFLGFRLKRLSDDPDVDQRSMQFSIRHLFLWMTVVACVVGLARVVEWAPLFYFEQAPLFPMVALGGCFTLISMIAVWSALGAERFIIRVGALAVCAPLIALAAGAVGLTLNVATWQNNWAAQHLRIGANFDFVLWLTWMYLASFFLSSTLLMFRTSGYRLVRDRRGGE